MNTVTRLTTCAYDYEGNAVILMFDVPRAVFDAVETHQPWINYMPEGVTGDPRPRWSKWVLDPVHHLDLAFHTCEPPTHKETP